MRLLLSIDRRESSAAAMETVELAAALRSRGVAGVDLSGNPGAGEWATWLPALRRARALGLPLTLHAAEARVSAKHFFHAFGPGRVWFMLFGLAALLATQLAASGTSVEICLCGGKQEVHARCAAAVAGVPTQARRRRCWRWRRSAWVTCAAWARAWTAGCIVSPYGALLCFRTW